MPIFATSKLHRMAEVKKLNRIKAVLAEKGLTNKSLGQQLGKSEFTVFKVGHE
jgi:DNA-binding NarL/FixJ family response regulator